MEDNRRKNRDILVEMGYEDSVVFENPAYDAAIIGVDTDRHVIYDFDKRIECLMEEEGMTYEEAVDFIDCNTIRALPYIPEHPHVMYRIEDYDKA